MLTQRGRGVRRFLFRRFASYRLDRSIVVVTYLAINMVLIFSPSLFQYHFKPLISSFAKRFGCMFARLMQVIAGARFLLIFSLSKGSPLSTWPWSFSWPLRIRPWRFCRRRRTKSFNRCTRQTSPPFCNFEDFPDLESRLRVTGPSSRPFCTGCCIPSRSRRTMSSTCSKSAINMSEYVRQL